MVSRDSATRNLCRLQPSLTIQIDENHSDMVKFGMGYHYIGILASKLESICTPSQTVAPELASQSARKFSQEEGPTPTIPFDPNEDLGESHDAQSDQSCSRSGRFRISGPTMTNP